MYTLRLITWKYLWRQKAGGLTLWGKHYSLLFLLTWCRIFLLLIYKHWKDKGVFWHKSLWSDLVRESGRCSHVLLEMQHMTHLFSRSEFAWFFFFFFMIVTSVTCKFLQRDTGCWQECVEDAFPPLMASLRGESSDTSELWQGSGRNC